MKRDKPIVIFGGGSLGSAIARGFVIGGVPRDSMQIIQRNEVRRGELQQEGFCVWPALPERMEASLLLLVVKPKDVEKACLQITRHISGNPIIVSAVAGVSGNQLFEILGQEYPIFRAKFSILAEAGSLPIPVTCCTNAANEKFPVLEQLMSPLGKLIQMAEAAMDLSGWDISSLPCIILGGMMRERLANVPSEDRNVVGKMLLTSLQREIDWLTAHSVEGDSLIDAIDELCHRIATPGGINDATIDYLESLAFWKISSKARDFYRRRLEATD